jgi:organic radical activating enzyme
MKISIEQKEHLLKESKSFCMLPWMHLHITPLGAALPCCIGNQQEIVGNANEHTMMDLVNSEKMSQLRKDMVDDILNPACSACHRHEQQGITSFRTTNNEMFEKYFDEALTSTDITGKLGNFKMRYFDIRLSNICNMKCRTCNSHYSSLWEQEDAKQGRKVFGISKEARIDHLNDILPHIQYMDMAYFAGGEPFITEEHYVMLEEMIKQNKTDITLRYNTNLSSLKYKDKDLIQLWSHFKNKIQVYASLDHYGERAEYMRHGTDWAQIETNFNTLMKNPNVSMTINSVVSIFNFVTFGDFYKYILDKKWLTTTTPIFTVYNMISPVHLAALALPNHHKEIGKNNIQSAVDVLKSAQIKSQQITQLTDAINWVSSDNTWEEHKDLFRSEVARLDSLRGENFKSVFPELQDLLDE